METTLLNTVSLPELVDLIRKDFKMVQKMIQPNAGRLYITDPIGKNQGNTKRYDEMDTQTFGRRKREGEASKKAAVGVGFNVTMTKKRIAMEIDITQEMLDENRHVEVGTQIRNLSHFIPQRLELDMSHLLTFASATSYVDLDGDTVTTSVGDGLALASTVHTLKFTSTTYSNRVSGDPVASQGGLEAAESLAITDVLSNFGERRVFNFNAWVTTDDPNTVNTVKRILRSSADVDAAHSGVMNVNANKYQHIILPYLATTATGARDSTKERIWFLIAIGQGTNGWQAYYGIWEPSHMKPQPLTSNGSNNEDYSRDIFTLGVREGRGLRVCTGRGLIASLPTS